MSEIFLNVDGELAHFNMSNRTLVSILEVFSEDGDETVINVTVSKNTEAM